MEKSSVKAFIEDAIEGGWMDGEDSRYRRAYNSIGDTLLNPLAWQAVSKTRGWRLTVPNEADVFSAPLGVWRYHWHRFIDHLADGKTIEEALALISS